MGWPLFFQGNKFYCSKENSDGDGECILKAACRNKEDIRIEGRDTLIKEFNLICEKADLVSFSNSILFLSMVVSGFIFPVLSDIKGRKITLILGFFISGISIFIAGFSNTFFFWQICIAMAGFGISGVEIVSLVYVSEISAKRFRNHAMVALTTVWALSQIILGIVLAVINNWRYMFILIMGSPYLLIVLMAYFIVYETPRYLLSKADFEVKN